jgi:phosphoribosylanthranilate isomerase
VGRPFALAGGLTPENIPAAIAAVHPDVVDLSSGVETDRVKDGNKMKQAVLAAHDRKE